MKLIIVALALVPLLAAAGAMADAPRLPWIEQGDVPLAAWAKSAVPKADAQNHPGDMVLFSAPNRGSPRRGVSVPGASFPIFGAKRGSGCTGRWLLVGPLAWTCADEVSVSAEEPVVPPGPVIRADGLLRDYFFVTPRGASAYADLELAEEGASDRELEGGWGVAGVRLVAGHNGRYVQTSKGLWLSVADLGAARPSLFRGETLGDVPLDIGWVNPEKANVWAEPKPKTKPKGAKVRFEVVHVLESSGAFVRVGDGEWLLAADVARPHVAPPPAEVVHPRERWIDVELASQTLVAYEGEKPVYATLVSTGRGPVGSEAATPPGVHRIWAKLLVSDMDNVERGDLDAHYSLEDVPYVQFFDKGVALHGTYWHRDFGHVKSHGCVNLAPRDARYLFDFTGPRLLPGWTAALPESTDTGTVVRVR